jgi:hypothetical protein
MVKFDQRKTVKFFEVPLWLSGEEMLGQQVRYISANKLQALNTLL